MLHNTCILKRPELYSSCKWSAFLQERLTPFSSLTLRERWRLLGERFDASTLQPYSASQVRYWPGVALVAVWETGEDVQGQNGRWRCKGAAHILRSARVLQFGAQLPSKDRFLWLPVAGWQIAPKQLQPRGQLPMPFSQISCSALSPVAPAATVSSKEGKHCPPFTHYVHFTCRFACCSTASPPAVAWRTSFQSGSTGETAGTSRL